MGLISKEFPLPKSHYFDSLYIEAIENCQIDIGEQPIQLVPLIFSHGLMGQPSNYSAHLRELAS